MEYFLYFCIVIRILAELHSEIMITNLKYKLLLAVALLITGSAIMSARQDTTRFRIKYVVNIPEIDDSYLDNEDRLAELRAFLEALRDNPSLSVTAVQFRGTASPEGSYEYNRWLSEQRLENFKKYVNQYIEIPDSLINAAESEITWDEFRQRIVEADIAYKDQILSIIDEGEKIVPYYFGRHIDARLLKLKKLGGGSVWQQLKSPILRDLRYGEAVFEVSSKNPLVKIDPIGYGQLVYEPEPFESLYIENVTVNVVPEWRPNYYLKTNFAAWALAITNIAFEADFAKHWSITLPIYYSGWNYFKSTIKFRTFTIEPEIRYWPRSTENQGFFLGAHFGLSYYNLAFNGADRYQDYRGKTPALGGGLSLGYRLPVSENNRWFMEFTLGAGVYPLDYSVFYNTPDVKDGQWHDRRKKTYIGIDNIGITLAYRLNK